MLCGVVLLAGCDGDPADLSQDASSATACECALTWEVDSVVPCIAPKSISFPSIIFSSHADEGKPSNGSGDEDTVPDCNAAVSFPQPVPPEPWSKQRIQAQCAGSANLCVSLKSGKAKEASDADCSIMEHCFDADYDVAGKVVELDELPGWAATDAACSNAFSESGGYVEFRVEGDLGCEDRPRVRRVQICPTKCGADPEHSDCKNCGNAQLSAAF
jgi:hypothetical protein